jgi:hypothetical protein
VLAVLAYQISDIATDFDKIKRQHFITDIQKQIRTNFNISLWEQRKYMSDVAEDSVKKRKGNYWNYLIICLWNIDRFNFIPIYTF